MDEHRTPPTSSTACSEADQDEAVDCKVFGVYRVEILEGPTDNPIRVVAPGGLDHQAFYTFGIEGAGWNLLTDMLQLIEPTRSRDIPYHLSCFISLVRHFPENWGLIDYGRLDERGRRHSECGR